MNRRKYYHRQLTKYFRFLIPSSKKVLEIGCATGELLASLSPAEGTGIDISEKKIDVARRNYPGLNFEVQDANDMYLPGDYDYIVLSDLLCTLSDIQKVFRNIHSLSKESTRIIISNYNFLWEPILKTAEKLGLKNRQPISNWISSRDISNMLELENLEIIKIHKKILLPIYIPLISEISNAILVNLPIIKNLSFISIFVVRKKVNKLKSATVSIVIPARNEKGNIESAVKRIPEFGDKQEIIFIEGGSSDGTYEEILRVQSIFKNKIIKALKQTGKGKGNAVREAFQAAESEILMILDGDLTMPPEDLPKYYNALVEKKAEFITGCRLVYPMEVQAMRTLNLIANKIFGMLFTFLLDQPIKDTLCGTKALYKKDYSVIQKGRNYFGEFDPFGDFDLLFGASKQNLKILEIPIRYRERQYGSTQINRFAHGWLLLKMCVFAARKIKFI